MRFNGDTTANKHMQNTQFGYASGQAPLYTSVDIVAGLNDSTSYDNGIIRIDFYDYANTTTYKMAQHIALTDNDAPGEIRMTNAKLAYYSTSAVTSIEFFLNTGSFSGGTYILYGVN
jgi:hypothetical protein